MNNHQLELAGEMARQGYLWHAHSPSELIAILTTNWGKSVLKPYPYGRTPSNEAFDSFMDSIAPQCGPPASHVTAPSHYSTARLT